MLDRLEAYYDAAPRSAARTEEIGPFTLFVSEGPWPYYARPRLGASGFTVDAIEAVRARQRELDAFGTRPLELTDYRSVGDKVVARAGDRTLVFTVVKSVIKGLIVYQPGEKIPELVRAPY